MDLYEEQNNEFREYAYTFVKELFDKAVPIALLPFSQVITLIFAQY